MKSVDYQRWPVPARCFHFVLLLVLCGTRLTMASEVEVENSVLLLMPKSIKAIDIHTHPLSDVAIQSANKIKVVSLNLAHGRKNAFSQIFLDKNQIKQNLNDVAVFLKETNADIVALQEADLPSWWSGNFDHVAYLAQQARYPYRTTATHVDAFFGHYGTAILSRYPIVQATDVDFQPTLPTTNKGFTLAKISLGSSYSANVQNMETNIENGNLVSVISLHLDFSRQSAREQQLTQLSNVLKTVNTPKIIVGDFNAHWFNNEGLLESFTEQNKLKGYQVASIDTALNTYNDKRIDWIFIEDYFAFTSYYSADDALSDHRAVVADIELSSMVKK